MNTKAFIPVRQQLWQKPVFSPEEPIFEAGAGGEPIAPTRHQVDRWKAEAGNFPATLDELPYGRRDRIDLIATRAYQAGSAAAQPAEAPYQAIETAPRDGSFFLAANSSEMIVCNWPRGCAIGRWCKSPRQKEWEGSFIPTLQPLTHWRPLPNFPTTQKH
jgi:hypothetical protein